MLLNRWWSLIVPPAIAIGLAIVLIMLLLPAPQRAGLPPGSSTFVLNSFKQISLAMHIYADKHGSLPPPAIYSKDGKPLLSWRVLVLPYLEHEQLYRKFRLDEPWDSAHNSALLPEMPALYNRFPDSSANPPYNTTCRVFVGPGAAFETGRGAALKEFVDGTDRTLLIVEASEAVPWTKPAELAYSPETSLPSLGGRFPEKFCVAYADGSVVWAPKTVAEAALRAAITRSGREPLDPLVP